MNLWIQVERWVSMNIIFLIKNRIIFLFAFQLSVIAVISCYQVQEKRNYISLSGTWEVAESLDNEVPSDFSRRIPVPGLMDLAQPPFDSSGCTYLDLGREDTVQPYSRRNYFWYKKTFELNCDSKEFAILKLHKVKFGHAVYVNGHYVGKYNFCFTPSYFDIHPYLNYHGSNELLIRVGATPQMLPDSIPFGFEIEKSLYYPGIYDRVELYFGNYPYIENIQVVPDIKQHTVTAYVYLENGKMQSDFSLRYKIKEKTNGKVVSRGIVSNLHLNRNQKDTIKVIVKIPTCRLWSPERPFLYELEIESPGDARKVTFGMREFKFDPETRMAMLNGKIYYLRGTNIAIHRFFEDTVRKKLPWDRHWIEKMHEEFKDMHWNSYRFHVGFAPEIWYEVADEKGFLIQDEYAIWALFLKDKNMYSTMQQHRHKASVLSQEYERWMKERWNHPSVVIWDAQNETWWDETGKAIEMVRHLDLSNRPWDNGFSPPQRNTDMIESHPYLFAHDQALTFNVRREYPTEGLLAHDLGRHPEPFNDPNMYEPPAIGKYENPVIINEYGWIWLYRNGSASSVAEPIWEFYHQFDTPEKRWEWRGRVIAAKTEYWRSRRDVAGVQHFCMLTCDRPWEPRSQVSDDWMDVTNLIMQPKFKRYVKPAFSPVGVFIDKFDRVYPSDKEINIPVVLFNDLAENWNGDLILIIKQGEKIVKQKQMENLSINPYQKIIYEFITNVPSNAGVYEMIAEIKHKKEIVFSSRLFWVE